MNHIEQTIADLTTARDRAQSAIELLTEFQAGLNGAPPAHTPAQALDQPPDDRVRPAGEDRPAPGRKSPPRRTVKQAKSNGKPEVRYTTLLARTLLPIIAKLPEPFKAGPIAQTANVTPKAVANFMCQNVKKKWITRTGYGEYKRGPKFPSADPAGRLLDEIHSEIEAAKPKGDAYE